jgi:hypothetical protein
MSRFLSRSWLAAVCLVLFSCGNGLWADPPGQEQGQIRPSGDAALRLLSLPSVQKELKLKPEQSQYIAGSIQSAVDLPSPFRGPIRRNADEPTDAERERRNRDLSDWHREQEAAGAEALGFLTANQLKRLTELWLQFSGAEVLHDALASELGLSVEQERRLYALTSEQQKKTREPSGRVSDDRAEQVRKEYEALKLAVLTETQKARFENLQGAAFEFKSGDRSRGLARRRLFAWDSPELQETFNLINSLAKKSVQKELQLTDEQTKQLETIRARNSGLRIRRFSPERNRQVEANGREALALLTPDQAARLKEIRLWIGGASALNDPGLAKELGLSAEQIQKLDWIAQDEFSEQSHVGRLSREAFADNPNARSSAWKEIAQQAEAQRLSVLTDDQRAQFDKLRGPKFDSAEPRETP